MPEIGTSGLMSGDGKRGNATAPVLDSTHGGGQTAALRSSFNRKLCAQYPAVGPFWSVESSWWLAGVEGCSVLAGSGAMRPVDQMLRRGMRVSSNANSA